MKVATRGVEASVPAVDVEEGPQNLLWIMDLENCLGALNEQRRLSASMMGGRFQIQHHCRRGGAVQTEVAFDEAAATAASVVNVVHEN